MPLTSDQIRSKYLEFFKKRGHAIIPSASLVPENDPSVLFNTAGMQPLVPYLLGARHPAGTRIVDVQKCVRTGDIDNIGDDRHLTFFEMLGNWSLGDYFKKESIEWSFEFLTSKEKGLGLDPKRFYVTVFKGENNIPRDNESIAIWKEAFAKRGITAEVAGEDEKISGEVRIIPLGVKDNFWIAGATGPCGGDTEIFYDTQYDTQKKNPEGDFSKLVDSSRLIEVWNNVFMEFNKTPEGKYEKLVKQNVDTGMGLERTTVVVNDKNNVFDTDIFAGIMEKIRANVTKRNDPSTNQKAERVVADHIRAAVFMIADGVFPSNTDQGYVLRRLIRRAVRYSDILGLPGDVLVQLADVTIDKSSPAYPNLAENRDLVKDTLRKEEEKFRKTLREGSKYLAGLLGARKENITGNDLFRAFTSYGFPFENSVEYIQENILPGLHHEKLTAKKVSSLKDEFFVEMKKHQDLSRVGAEKKFKGGLGDTSEKVVQYHTATHLLNAALRQVLGTHVLQKGSNITIERLRFDFSHDEKMTDLQKRQVEDLVNSWIEAKLPVEFKEFSKTEAEKIALHSFNEKYGDIVKVYSIGTGNNYISREFCGGPHVNNTGELTHFKIQKEEAVSAGVRRIKAILE